MTLQCLGLSIQSQIDEGSPGAGKKTTFSSSTELVQPPIVLQLRWACQLKEMSKLRVVSQVLFGAK